MKHLAKLLLPLSLCFSFSAMANCKSDYWMQNHLAEMLNEMTKGGNCVDTVSRSFMFQTFQEQHLEVAKRLQTECNPVNGNTIEELQSWIENKDEAEKACNQSAMFKPSNEGIDEVGATGENATEQDLVASPSQSLKAARPLEIALVMDTTGSMWMDGKITGAKTAATQLLDTIYGGTLADMPESEYIRFALVPFAAAVRLDQNAYDFDLNWIDTEGLNPLSKLNFNDPTWNNYMAWGKLKTSPSGNLAWNGCVESRARGNEGEGTDYSLNDVAPSVEQPDTIFPAYFSPDSPSIADRNEYPSEFRRVNWTGTYIPEDAGKPNEITGLKKHQAQDFTEAGLEVRQKNEAKYDGRVIQAETTAASFGPWSGCAKSPIVPMTHKRANIDAGITAMSAAGSTLVAEGISWGFRVLSPSEPFSKVEGTPSIAPDTISTFNHPRWRKVMVLVVDGENDLSAGVDALNGTVYSAYGRGTENIAYNRFGSTSISNKVAELDAAMTTACNKVKSAGIEFYVATFGDNVSSSTRAILKSCATDEDNYHHSPSNADLANFFNHIGEDLLGKSP